VRRAVGHGAGDHVPRPQLPELGDARDRGCAAARQVGAVRAGGGASTGAAGAAPPQGGPPRGKNAALVFCCPCAARQPRRPAVVSAQQGLLYWRDLRQAGARQSVDRSSAWSLQSVHARWLHCSWSPLRAPVPRLCASVLAPPAAHKQRSALRPRPAPSHCAGPGAPPAAARRHTTASLPCAQVERLEKPRGSSGRPGRSGRGSSGRETDIARGGRPVTWIGGGGMNPQCGPGPPAAWRSNAPRTHAARLCWPTGWLASWLPCAAAGGNHGRPCLEE